MNRSNIKYLQEFTASQMNHWALFPLYMMFTGMLKSFVECDDPRMGIWLAAGIIPFAFYLCRTELSRLCLRFSGRTRAILQSFFLAASHLIIILVFVMFVPCHTTAGRFLCVFTGTCYGIYSLYLRLETTDYMDHEFIMPVAVGFSAVSAFMVRYLGHTQWDSYFIISLACMFGIYFLNHYLKGYLNFLTVNESSAGFIPEKDIFLSGSRMVLYFAIFTIAVLFLASGIGWLGIILRFLREIFLIILRFFFSLIPENGPDTFIPDSAGSAPEGMSYYLDAGRPFLIWEILEVLAMLGILTFAALAAFKLLKRLILFIRSRMLFGSVQKSSASQECVLDVREKCDTETSGKGAGSAKTGLWTAFRPKERIRKLYRKHILEVSRTGSSALGGHSPNGFEEHDPALLTAREWGILLDETEMSDIYEKVRYSEEICTAEDLRRMKKAVKL